MHKKIGYRVLITGLRVGLGLLACTAIAKAQYAPTTPTQVDLYCSGVIDDKPVPNDTYLISGEDSGYRTTFQEREFVYINKGAEQGVRVGDQFDVIRPRSDQSETVWFKYQTMLTRAMGTRYADIGRLRVVHVDPKTSTAEMDMICEPMYRGDIVRPFVARPAPQYHNVNLDPFAPPSGKKTAMVVSGKEYAVQTGPLKIVYVNLGNAQGVRVGDYFRVFRYQGTRIETAFEVPDTAYKAYGFGSTPVAYQWNNLPRQILGEGIVVRTGANSSTVMLTNVRGPIYIGNYVELE
jgi:hypothetical protein